MPAFNRRYKVFMAALLASASVFALQTAAFADVSSTTLPTGGTVAAGSATVSQQGANLTVNQTSQKTIINWQSFDVGSGATVNFVQPNSASIALNRVLSATPSSINGKITANGQIYLINPAGIVFGAGAVVNVGGLVASTMGITDSDFMSGQNTFNRNGSTGSIVNQGTLTATPGGMIALLAPELRNEGTLSAQLGTVVMAAGEKVVLNINSGGGVTLQVDPAQIHTMIENRSIVVADNGSVILSAKAADTLLGSVINNSGVIEAASLTNKGGTIELSGATDITNTGTLNASGTNGGSVTIAADQTTGQSTIGGTVDVSGNNGIGGTATITGHHVMVSDGAQINATGTTGGGTINVGGSWEAQDASIPESEGTYIAPTAVLNASATVNGNGGTVVVRSDVTDPNSVTRAYGTFLATGGPQGGNGGRIETSGYWLDTAGSQGGAWAPLGKAGEWLFDPYNVTISSDSTANTTDTSADGTETWSSNDTSSVVSVSDIENDLNNGTNVTITTGSGGDSTILGDITVSSAIAKTAGAADVTLTLSALNTIVLNADITDAGGVGNAGKLNLNIDADSDLNGVGIIILNSNLSTNGGYVKFGTKTYAYINGVSTLVGGDVYVSGSNEQTISTNGGEVQFNGQVLLANPSGLNITTNGGNVTFASLLDSGDSYTFVATVESWNQAEIDAAAMGNGEAGNEVGASYLATITSRLENAIGAYTAGYRGGWLGAERTSGIAPDTGYIWYWVTGPEGLENGGKGLPFSDVSTSVNGMYVNWNSGEPNGGGTGGNEYALEFVNTAGQWNDINPTDNYMLSGYLVETNLAASPLSINAGSGTVTFAGAVGSNKPLSTLDVTASNIDINGGAITTTTGQTYTGSTALGSSSTALTVTAGDFVSVANQAITNASGDDATLSITASGDVVLSANSSIGSSNGSLGISLTSQGGTLSLDSGSSINSNGGAVSFTTDNLSVDSTATVQGGSHGSLSIEPYTQGRSMGIGTSAAGLLNIPNTLFTSNFINNSFGSVTFGGDTTGLLTIGNVPSLIHSTTTFESDDNIVLAADANLSTTGTVILQLDNGGTVTENAAATISADKLLLSGDDGTFTLTNTHNSVSTLAADTGNVNYINQGSLDVSTVGSTEGVTTTDDVTLQASGATADITLDKPVTSTDGNITLAAGRNFINNNASNTGIIASGTGKQYFVYATDYHNTTPGMTTGFTNRYGQAYTAGQIPSVATSGNWFFYSMASPVLTETLTPLGITYGTSDPTVIATYSGLVNGDTISSIDLSGTPGTLASYIASGAGYRPAGTYTITATPDSLTNVSNYTIISAGNGTLTVNKRNITITGFTAADKTADGSTLATITDLSGFAGVLLGDNVSGAAGGVAEFSDTLAGNSKKVTEISAIPGGSDGGNYNITTTGLTTTATIKPSNIFVPPVSTTNIALPASSDALQTQPSTPQQQSKSTPLVSGTAANTNSSQGLSSGTAGQGVTVAQITTGTPGTGGVLATVGNTDAGFSFTVPVASSEMKVNDVSTASLANGGSLPSWLTYDSSSHTFSSASVPPGGLPIVVAVTDARTGKSVEVTISE